MQSLKDIIERCHQRHKKPLRQRKTIITPAPYKGLPYHFTVYCAYRYPVRLYDLEQAAISFMPIGRAPNNDHGPNPFGGERFLKRQTVDDWGIRRWQTSWGIQVYTGIPSERYGAQWHDLNFTYQALCAAPDAVLHCIETLVNAVVNPLLTMSKSGGLRFSCRVPDYLHPNTHEAKQYIYKHTPITENPHQRDVYLEIFGKEGHNRWDARYEILLGNLLGPPVISEEVLFTVIDKLRAEIHDPTPLGQRTLEPDPQTTIVVPTSLGSNLLDLARDAFLEHGYSYVKQEDNFHQWTRQDSEGRDISVLLWEDRGTVWVRAVTPNTELPMNATSITDIWDDTGIIPPVPATGLPVSDKVLAVREGKLSPLAIKRLPPVLHKPEQTQKDYNTYEQSKVQIQQAFERTERIIGLIAETGAGKTYAAGSYVLNNEAISLNAGFWTVEEIAKQFQKRNVQSVARWRARRFRWDQVKDMPVDVRMATPFQHGNMCEDYERCSTLEARGGDPNESICPQCPVQTECQDRGYLSQPAALKRATAQISGTLYKFYDPQYSEIVAELIEKVDGTERLCITDQIPPQGLFFECYIPKRTLEEWSVNWQEEILGKFAKALLNALEIKTDPNDNAVRRIRTAVKAFQQHETELVRQMCQVPVKGKVINRGYVDAETGKELARFTIEFEGGASAYIPLDKNAKGTLTAKGLPLFIPNSFVLNKDMKIPMQMAEAIQLGILNTETVQSIQKFPTVCRYPNWTFWHQMKHFLAYYTQDADAPMILNHNILHLWMPPVLHSSVKRLLLMSSTFSERDLRKAFPNEEIKVIRVKPAAWVEGNQVFQIRTGTYPRETVLEHNKSWNVLGVSKVGQRFFQGIRSEIARDPNVKHAIVTDRSIIKQLPDVAESDNVCFIADFKVLEGLETVFQEAQVLWIVDTPYWSHGIIWRRAQILYGNNETPLCYEIETESHRYKDERVQNVYETHVGGLLSKIIGRAGLTYLPNKKVVLITSFPLPDITDRPETLLFDWEDFEVAGGLHKLPEVITTRERFEAESAAITAETSRTEVERILGCSTAHANRLLNKLRGGNIPRVPFREQILSLLANGEKKASELAAAIEGNPKSIDNELRRLVDTGEIVRVRRGMYALPKY